MQPTPLAPLQRWPVQLYEPRFGFAWFVPPRTLINQSVGTRADVFAANWVQARIDLLLAAQRREIVEAGGLLVIHDWRTLTSYDPEARRVFLERMRQRPKGYLHAAVAVLQQDVSPLLRMAIQGANMLSAISIGGQIRIEHDVAAVLRKHNLQAPSPTVRFPMPRDAEG